MTISYTHSFQAFGESLVVKNVERYVRTGLNGISRSDDYCVQFRGQVTERPFNLLGEYNCHKTGRGSDT